ncbi:MAG: hypothetical protein KDA55_07355, partial [Planctomycetales bacterium]|nr:hypothetical protein [Planctomycetales bacterium]
MNADLVLDYGRSRGELAAFGQYVSNQGPLIRQNKLGGNEINGLQVRGGTLSTDSVWDDTDIVHVMVDDQIYVPDLHTFGGLRLESKPNESLVVKLSGDAGFVSTGRPLDIDDRVGGMLHVVGTPGFPVIFTSLADDSAGAGFDPQGLPQMDTNGNGASVGSAGDWNGLLIDQYSHDRNVDIITELESPQAVAPGPNATAGSAQTLGTLATSEKTGDESLRLGFAVEGVINSPNDLDVYQFFAKGGTEVWIDIDRTSHALDTVVELIDVNGNILAQSDDSFTETSGATNLFVDINTYPMTNRVNVLQKSDYYQRNLVSGTPKDHFSTNVRDAGMRVVLHGSSTTTNKYFVRVRSSNIDRTAGGNPADLQDLAKVNDGLTSGSYQLNIRLRETDEFPGSTIRFADVRYADTGIEVRGMPLHSPLGGEATEISGNNDSPGAGQDLGNLLSADRATLGVAGQSSGSGDIDFYQFDVLFDSIQQGPNGPPVSTVFDIDYADGFGRPDLILSVFDGNGRLVLMGNDSNIADDQGGPNLGTDSKDLSRGSGGLLDPYIGSALLPTGSYSVAVSTAAQIPAQAQQYQLHNPANTSVRLEPVTSVERLAEDRIGSSGGSGVFGADALPLLFDAPGSTTSPANALDWHLGDVALYITSGSTLTVLDPFTGAIVGTFTNSNTGTRAHSDLAMRQDGKLFSFSTPVGVTRNDGNSGNFLQFDLGTGNATSIGDDGIATFQDDTNAANLPNDIAANVGYQFEALAFRPDGSDNRLFAIGNRFGNSNNVGYTRNVLYRFNQNT